MKKSIALALLLAIAYNGTALAAQAKNMVMPAVAETEKNIVPESTQNDLYNISPGNSERRYAVTIWVNHNSNTYAVGDTIVISARAERDGYLTMLDTDPTGKTTQIFPNRFQANNFLKKGEEVQIPGKNAGYRFRVHGPVGTELIKAILTDSPENVLGASAKDFSNDDYPVYQGASNALLSKNIISGLHNQNWDAYDKLIRIVDSNTAAGADGANLSPLQIEQALKVNAAQIRAIQQRLNALNYYRGSIDGILGTATRQALMAWQRDKQLPETGYLDSVALSQLVVN